MDGFGSYCRDRDANSEEPQGAESPVREGDEAGQRRRQENELIDMNVNTLTIMNLIKSETNIFESSSMADGYY